LTPPATGDCAVEFLDALEFPTNTGLNAVGCLVHLIRKVVTAKHVSIAGPTAISPRFEVLYDVLRDNREEFFGCGSGLWRPEGALESSIEGIRGLMTITIGDPRLHCGCHRANASEKSVG